MEAVPFEIEGGDIDLPPTHFVTFSVSQLWDIDDEVKMVSVKYHETLSEQTCDKNINVTNGTKFLIY